MPNRASVSRTSGSTVPRSSPTIVTWLRTLSSARMRTKSSERLAHVGALRGVAALGNPVEPEQPHHVIDAQRAAVPAILADRFGEQPVAIFAMLLRIGRREAPILALAARNRPAASPRGSRRRRTAGAPRDRSRSGRWPAPDRDRGRWTGRVRARAAARRAIAGRSATAATRRTLPARQCSRANACVSAESGYCSGAGQSVQIQMFGSAVCRCSSSAQ